MAYDASPLYTRLVKTEETSAPTSRVPLIHPRKTPRIYESRPTKVSRQRYRGSIRASATESPPAPDLPRSVTLTDGYPVRVPATFTGPTVHPPCLVRHETGDVKGVSSLHGAYPVGAGCRPVSTGPGRHDRRWRRGGAGAWPGNTPLRGRTGSKGPRRDMSAPERHTPQSQDLVVHSSPSTVRICLTVGVQYATESETVSVYEYTPEVPSSTVEGGRKPPTGRDGTTRPL